MSYSYHISFNKAVPSFAEFFPEGGVQTTNKQIVNQEFFREECSEIKITRIGNQYGNNETVYDQLETWFFDDTKFDDEIEIEIYRGTLATGTLYFAGFFSISDGTIDREKRTFKFVSRIDDKYRSLWEDRETRYDVSSYRFGSALTGKNVIAPEEKAISWQPNPSPGFPGSGFSIVFDTFITGGSDNVLTSVIDSDAGNKESKYFVPTGASNGDTIVIEITAYNQTGAGHPYMDIFDSSDNSVAGKQQITAAGTYTFTVAGVPAAVMLFTDLAADTTNFSMTLYAYVSDGTNNSIANLYMAFIETFITNVLTMDLSGFIGGVKSTYLNNDALPSDAPSSIVTFISGNPNGNYVSLDTDNPLNELLIGQTRLWVDADVTELKVSFADLMSDLKQTYDCGWYIDADGDYRIEHVKYFEKLRDDSTALDLTSAPFDKYKAETDAKELTMNKALLGNREQFEWQQVDEINNSEDFIGVDIIYDNLETIENVFRHEARRITTDLQYLLSNAADASADGLVFLQTRLQGGNTYIVENETGILSTDLILNGHMSWANLQDKYWTWRRMSENGDMNAGDTTAFDSAVKFLQQDNVRFGYQITLDPYTKITTSQGTGQQTEVVRSLDTDFLTMLISYNPYA